MLPFYFSRAERGMIPHMKGFSMMNLNAAFLKTIEQLEKERDRLTKHLSALEDSTEDAVLDYGDMEEPEREMDRGQELFKSICAGNDACSTLEGIIGNIEELICQIQIDCGLNETPEKKIYSIIVARVKSIKGSLFFYCYDAEDEKKRMDDLIQMDAIDMEIKRVTYHSTLYENILPRLKYGSRYEQQTLRKYYALQ